MLFLIWKQTAKGNMQIHFDFTSNNCIIPRDKIGIFAVKSVPELQVLSKSVKAMKCSILCSSSIEFSQKKKFHIHRSMRGAIHEPFCF